MATEQLDQLANKQEETVNIEMTVQEFNVVLNALQELPHRVVDVFLKKIFAQAQEQLRAAAQPQVTEQLPN